MEWECLGTTSSLKCRITYDDSDGKQLASDTDARSYGARVVRELRESDFQSAGAILHVRDEGGRIIQSIPL